MNKKNTKNIMLFQLLIWWLKLLSNSLVNKFDLFYERQNKLQFPQNVQLQKFNLNRFWIH